ncbi:group II intron maturase-specific domain-containing protein, partial [Streptomyces sp. NPDC050619]|uniref:group II intron maturase-specific domain-containing protein n=1 Tax=Streptomyces sp. NPDC050619 TaxID=3157214 RepID=UPI003422216A
GRRSEPGAKPGTPVLVRYADDFVVLCHTEQEALKVRNDLAEWLEPRGLFFNEEKTEVVHLEEGFDFLGFNVRRYRGKLLIKPSKAAVTRVRERLKAEMLSLRGANSRAVMKRLAPIIRGWSAYYRTVVSKEVFTSLDDYLWKLTYKWAKHTHPTKPRHWVTSKYFGRFNRSRQNNWVFGDRVTGIYLPQFAWTKIVRHVPVRGTASVYDPALIEYWETRRRKRTPPPMDKTSVYLAYKQKGLCPLCEQALIAGAEYEPEDPRQWIEWFAAHTKALHKHHFFVYRRDGGTDDRTNLRLVHSECHRLHHAADGKRTRK